MAKTTTVTREYDEDGRVVKETTVESDDSPALAPNVLPFPYIVPAYPHPPNYGSPTWVSPTIGQSPHTPWLTTNM